MLDKRKIERKGITAEEVLRKLNKAKGTKYADLTAVWEAIRGPLTANELSVTQEPVDCPEGWVPVKTAGEAIALLAAGEAAGVDPKRVIRDYTNEEASPAPTAPPTR